MNKLQDLTGRGVKYVRNAFADIQARPANALLDTTRGALMGVTTDVAGYPVDLMTMALRPFGYTAQQPVGGSEWLANKLTYPTGAPAELAGRTLTGMLTPGPEDLLRLAGVLPKNTLREMTVYHGSPHDFDKFDMSKIGTGEGKQAYGHGLYVAETPDVAKHYTVAEENAFKTIRRGSERLDLPLRESTDIADNAIYDAISATAKRGTVIDDAVLAKARAALEHESDIVAGTPRGKFMDAAVQKFDTVAAKLKGAKVDYDPGHLYTVDLADEHIAKMLDWDKPLSEQPEAVQGIVRDMLKEQGYLRPNDNGPRQLQSAFKSWKIERAGMAESGKGESIYGLLSKQLGSDEAASNYLRERGIPGIRYLDQASRDAGKGTRNFVVFDDKLLKILKKE